VPGRDPGVGVAEIRQLQQCEGGDQNSQNPFKTSFHNN
jgi:hypothetical protein